MDEDIQNMIKSKKYENENNYFWRGADIRKVNNKKQYIMLILLQIFIFYIFFIN